MPFVQRSVEPKFLSRSSGLFDEDGRATVSDEELQAVTNVTLCNALRQLASLVLVADDIFQELGGQLKAIRDRSDAAKKRIAAVDETVARRDPKQVTVPEGNICSFALVKEHYAAKRHFDSNLFGAETRPDALKALYEAANKTPVHVMRQLDRWRRDGHRSSRFFLCTPVLGAKRRKIRNTVDIDIETSLPAAVEGLRRWTSEEALGDVTVAPDCAARSNGVFSDGEDSAVSEEEEDEDRIDGGVDHKLPSPEEQLQVTALKFPAEIVAVDVSGRSFDRMSMQRRSLIHAGSNASTTTTTTTTGVAAEGEESRRRTRSRKTRGRRRNTLAGTDQKEIRDALTAADDDTNASEVARSKSGDLLRAASKKESPESKKTSSSHFNSLKQWGKNRYDRFMNRSNESKTDDNALQDEFNVYETVTVRRRREKHHERNPSVSSSEKSVGVAVKMREGTVQRRQRRNGGVLAAEEPPHSSSGNWSASSESGRASIGSEITKSTATATTATASTNSLNLPRRFAANASSTTTTTTTSSVTSEGTLTPDIIHDLHEDGETSSVYSCDTEGYYTSFHVDSGLKTLKEEEMTTTTTTTTGTSFRSNSAENEYELFGKGSTSTTTTTSSAGTVCTALRASDSDRSLATTMMTTTPTPPAVPQRKSSLSNVSNRSVESVDGCRTDTVKRSPLTKSTSVGVVLEAGDVSPDSGRNTCSSPVESASSPANFDLFDFSESSDVEGAERVERIRIKTTINSSRIPSMCVITPPHSDDEGVATTDARRIHVDPQTGYATVESIEAMANKMTKTTTTTTTSTSIRAASPSGGTVTVVGRKTNAGEKTPTTQPMIKASLMPLNNMFGRLKNNLASLAGKRDRSKSPGKEQRDQQESAIYVDAGEYVTIADVRNNNNNNNNNTQGKSVGHLDQDVVNKNLTNVLSGRLKDSEYVSLNELPTGHDGGGSNVAADEKTRPRHGGARVTLDADGQVVYSSDSLRRGRKGAHSTFEPGPFVKTPPSDHLHRAAKTVRPVTNTQDQMVAAVPRIEFNRPSPITPRQQQSGKVVIRACSSGAAEIVRTPAAVVTPMQRPTSPPPARGAYVNMQQDGGVPKPTTTTHLSEKDARREQEQLQVHRMLNTDAGRRSPSLHHLQRGGAWYSTLPSKRTQFFHAEEQIRSVTPDITRGLEKNQKLGMPVRMPAAPVWYGDVGGGSPKVSPIDPRNSVDFKSSTPVAKELSAAANLEQRLLSPKKSTMSNEELYAVIHKSRKKLNIPEEGVAASSPPQPKQIPTSKQTVETGYIGIRSPTKAPEPKGTKKTSTLDFKRLLLQKTNALVTGSKKMSAVERLKLSKVQSPTATPPTDVKILDLSSSPRSLLNRRFGHGGGGGGGDAPPSPCKAAPPKILSPRSQWRFASPRSDVLSSTILEDCREEESPEGSLEKRSSTDGRAAPQTRTALFFGQRETPPPPPPPTLETAF